VGKTSLMKRLLYEEFSPDENITQGIEINNWLLNTEIANNLRINFWDFDRHIKSDLGKTNNLT
jgi:internalin A